MAQFSKTVTYDSTTYLLVMWSPTKSLKLSARLLKLFGETFAALFSEEAAPKGKKKSEVDTNKVVQAAVRALVSRLDEDEVMRLILDCLESVNIGSTMPLVPVFDDHFKGKISELMKLLVDQLKFQYSDLFTGAGRKLAQIVPALSL